MSDSNEINLEGMSDAEFSNAEDEIFAVPDDTPEESVDTDEPEDTEEEVDVDDEGDNPGDDQSADDDEEPEDGSDEDEDQVDDDTDTPDGENDTDDTNDDIDFEAGYNDLQEILKPFKANGKDMTVDNVEDARRLMQMGAGFQKRMGQLKPHLKIIKSLENNGLLDVGKINELIDLSKKDPNAIAKLIKEAGVNPLDIDTEGDGVSDYKPNSYEVSDSEFDLDQAIDSIKGNESYDKSIKVMGEQWDQKSRTIIAENPEIVGIIDGHIQSGVFDTVQNFVEKEQALGRMSGMSDVESYREAAIALQKSGVLEGGDANDASPKTKKPEANSLEVEAKKKQEAKRRKKRKAAAPSKGKSKSKGSEPDYDNMSDEDFLAEIGQG